MEETDVQDVKDYLCQLLNIDYEINSKIDAAIAFRETFTKVQATRLKVINVQESGTQTQEDRIIKYAEMEKEIDDTVDDLVQLKSKIIKEINKLDDRLHIIVLTERYVNNKKWEKVADDIEQKDRNIYKLHRSALQEFYKYNKESVIDYLENKNRAVNGIK